MTKSSYRVDPVTDLRYAREFMAAPVGLHSPGLQRVLNVFRGEPPANTSWSKKNRTAGGDWPG